MKKLIVLCLTILLLCSSGFAQETEEESDDTRIKNLVTAMYNSSVSIFSIGGQYTSICSGVVIKNDAQNIQVITAKHCSDVYEEVYVEGIKIDYSIESSSDDLAILILSSTIPDKSPVQLADRGAKRKEIIYYLGFPNTEVYTRVGVVWLNAIDNSYAFMEIIPGCSGGGVYNEYGELIGIAFASISGKNKMAIYEPLPDIRKFLREIKKDAE